MTIIPAIDIIDGHCVRLSQGDYDKAKTYYRDPLDAAKQFEDWGLRRIHIVDLDGAKASQPKNLAVLERIASQTSLEPQFGGGIKSTDSLRSVFSAGASRAIGGSVAALQPEMFEEWLRLFGDERIILGADIKEGQIAVKGWLEKSAATLDDLLQRFMRLGLSQAIVTDIAVDGMLCGPDVKFYAELQKKYPSVDITVSGGISSQADLDALASAGLRSVIIGKAIYEGRITFHF
ncbi:MAG: 1-(5-phosphoribosyl)-5-[(5-phosphoribosylamino)methylideneamino]imidazole-4-carboxamide isomerase [Bacteroidales bacterium]|nr:1-(5-phosphoribosyl)-5-[(5-phosphoribosylamino)methylideneamino]imidazole-4-carboxamide isomerase [Bacteroidales bacterium]